MSFNEMFKMDCRRATYLSELRKEGKLTFSQRFGVWFHLLYCKVCALFFKQSELIEKHVHNYREEQIHRLDTSRREKIQQLLDKEINNKPGWPV